MIVNTTLGEMDESLLAKTEGQSGNGTETIAWVEYYFYGELVHRSAHLSLKPVVSATEIGAF